MASLDDEFRAVLFPVMIKSDPPPERVIRLIRTYFREAQQSPIVRVMPYSLPVVKK